jgi:hypothetical protein
MLCSHSATCRLRIGSRLRPCNTRQSEWPCNTSESECCNYRPVVDYGPATRVRVNVFSISIWIPFCTSGRQVCRLNTNWCEGKKSPWSPSRCGHDWPFRSLSRCLKSEMGCPSLSCGVPSPRFCSIAVSIARSGICRAQCQT